MRNIEFDNGVEEFSLAGGGVLRFNPSDPNLYARFLEAEQRLRELETELNQQAQSLSGSDKAAAIVALTARADKEVKQWLDQVFGCGNDFDKALNGVNLLSQTGNGQRVVTNLFAALEQILVEGAARFAAEKAAAIRAEV